MENQMKKIIILLVSFIFILTACGSSEPTVGHQFMTDMQAGNSAAARTFTTQNCIDDSNSVLCLDSSLDTNWSQYAKQHSVTFTYVTQEEETIHSTNGTLKHVIEVLYRTER